MQGHSSVRAFVGLGSNLGDRLGWLGHAVRALAELPATRLVRVSSLYETRPWGLESQPDFYNMVAELSTRLSPEELLSAALAIERRLGRVRTVRWGPRTIDIDLLVYDHVRARTPDLTLPHPRMLQRAFVLVPLAELAPDLVVEGAPIRDHLAALGDTARDVRRLGPAPFWPLNPGGPSPRGSEEDASARR